MYSKTYFLIEKLIYFQIGFHNLTRRFRVQNKIIAFCLFAFIPGIQTVAQCLKDITDSKPVTISANSQNAGFAVSKAFDNADNANGGWSATQNVEPGSEAWISVFFTGGAEFISGYSISALDDNSGNNNNAPSAWVLQASNDGSSWTHIDSRSGEVFSARGETHVYSFINSTSYSYYRLMIQQTFFSNATQVAISEIQLFAQVCISGTVFQDNGDRNSAFNGSNDTPLPGIPVSIVTNPSGNVVATTTTNIAGSYSFDASQVPSSGSFSVIARPPANKIFVSRPINLWSTHAVFASIEDEPSTGSVFFDYHVNPTTGSLSAVNRMKFVGGNLDFGLADATPPFPFSCANSALMNLITVADNGHFGNSTNVWETAHPHQKGFSYNGNLYSTMPAGTTNYIFSNTTGLSGPARGVLYGEGEYAITYFPGTVSDIAYAPYMSQMLNNISGGWRKSFGTTTADVNDMFLAVNGATTGSLPFFKQTNLNLTGGTTYTLAFYGKHANSFAQGALADAQLVIEVLDNASSVVTSGTLNLNRTTSFLDDRPEAPWQLRIFSFTAPGGSGPFTVQLRASTTAAVGNDFYIDDIVLYPCSYSLMPIRLANFTARKELTNNVKLEWEIKTPSSGRAETEHSYDGKNFVAIGKINMNSAQMSYSSIHVEPGGGIHYYRLKMTDAQGLVTYSAIRSIAITTGNNDRILLYPNPVTDKLYIQSAEIIDAYEIIDASGKLIRKQKNRTNQLQIDAAMIQPGVYYLKLVKNDQVSMHKLVIRK